MTTKPPNHTLPDDPGTPGPPPCDELDGLLRQWHSANAEKAAAGRDRLLDALAKESDSSNIPAPIPFPAKPSRPRITIRSLLFNRYVPLAAAAIFLAALLPFILPAKSGIVRTSTADLPSNIVMAPDGGRLDALDRDGNTLGPCALKHTDVKAEISGRFSRVTITQQYQNRFTDKIEALYIFPLSDSAGVDRMTMTIGDRVIVGEVKERESARRIYEQARDAGRTASLLEQERPNIFTQSVANIDPGATINIEISYVELIAEHDGELSFNFPTVVSPRYIPGQSDSKREIRPLPTGVQARRGLVLLSPATVAVTDRGPGISRSDSGPDARLLNSALAGALAITPPPDADTNLAFYGVRAAYPDGSAEEGFYRTDGLGHIGGRWFYCPEPGPHTPITPAAKPGEPFAQPTDKVPDADRITPMPTRPNIRAGHDISISVTLDTGGPGITTLDSPLHKTVRTDLAKNALDQPRRVSIALASLNEIPNRDFVLKWKQSAAAITNRVFTNTGEHGNFFSLQLEPPARVDDDAAVPRELIFVVDTSGSMNGRPIALARTVMQKAIDAMRPQDSFNIITFAGATRIMWEHPRPNTPANRTEAQNFIATWEGSGGTEMMTAIEAALRQTPGDAARGTLTLEQLANLPADGRRVSVVIDDSQIDTNRMERGGLIRTPTLIAREGLSIKSTDFTLPQQYLKRADQTLRDESIVLRVLVHGTWATVNGERILQADNAAEMFTDSGVRPLRIVMFLTDAEVGNDFAIIDAIKRNRATTRVFSFGIGNSVNRFLIDQMALAGGGEPEYVYAREASDTDADAAVERFNRRTRTPVLTDITLTFTGVQPLDVLPAPDNIPDLFDNRPLTFLGRYTAPGTGTVTIKGQTSRGRWEKTIPLNFPAQEPQNSSLPTLWARAKIDAVMAQDLPGIQRGQPSPDVRAEIIKLGETFNVMSQYTSFVAVDKLRVTINGKPRLVHIPVELPDQTNWAGYFGDSMPAAVPADGDAEKERALRSSKDAPAAGGTAGIDRSEPAQQILTLSDGAITGLMACNETLTKQSEPTRKADIADKAIAESPPAAASAPLPPAPAAMSESRGGSGRPAGPAGGQSPLTTGAPAAKPADAPSKLPATVGLTTENTDLKESAEKSKRRDSLASNHSYGTTLDDVSRLRAGSRQQLLPWSRSDNRAYDRNAKGYAYTTQNSTSARKASEAMTVPEHLMDFPSDWPTKSWTRGELGVARDGGGTVQSAYPVVPDPDPQSLVALAAAQLAGAGRYDEAKSLACSNLAADLGLALGNQANTNNVFLQLPGNAAGNAVQQNVAQPPITQICGALTSNLPEAEKKAAINEARVQASANLLENRRVLTINRKLAPDLFAQTPRGQWKQQSSNDQSGNTAQSTNDNARTITADSGTASNKANNEPDPKAAPAFRTAAPPTSPGAPIVQAAPQPILVAILLSDTTTKTIDALKALGIQIDTIKPEANVVLARVMPDQLEALALLEIVKRVEPITP